MVRGGHHKLIMRGGHHNLIKKQKTISKHKSVVRTVLLEVGNILGILKKSYLKLAIYFLMHSNSIARPFLGAVS